MANAARMRTNPAATAAILIAVASAALIFGAWFFQLAVGLSPCPLCLEQRIPHYVAIPLAVVVAVAAWRNVNRRYLLAGLVAVALVLLFGAGLGVYHSGIEWKWWSGPLECSGSLGSLGSGKSLIEDLADVQVVRCDEAAWRFLGLSLAGWNALFSLALVVIAAWAIAATARARA